VEIKEEMGKGKMREGRRGRGKAAAHPYKFLKVSIYVATSY